FPTSATALTHASTLSLHDALPILRAHRNKAARAGQHSHVSHCPLPAPCFVRPAAALTRVPLVLWRALSSRHTSYRLIPQELSIRSEEHTSQLPSRFDIVCRLLLHK